MTEYEEIINFVLSSDLIPKIAHKYKHYLKWDCEDYKQEMYLILLEIPQDKVISLFHSGDLIRYLMQVLKNQLFNKKSTFSRKYERFIDKREIQNENDDDIDD